MSKEQKNQEEKKALHIGGVVRSYLKENLRVKIELDFDYSKRSCSIFDVIVELDGEEISKTDFEVNFPCS